MAAIAADHHLLFGLLALQNGLIDQVQLVAAFQAWTRDKARPLAEHLVARGDLDADAASRRRGLVGAAPQEARRRRRKEPGRHLRRRGRPARRLAATRRPGHRGDPGQRRLRATGSATTPTGPPATPWAPPPPTASGSASCGLTPGAAWAPSSWRSTPSCTARSPSSRSSTTTPTTRSAAQRFLLEAEITGGLEHPGIVPVYGLGTYGDGRPYYAMRFIRGDSLKEADRPLPRRHVRSEADPGPAVAGAAQAAAAVHSTSATPSTTPIRRGVLHRDIKPGNVIVGKHGETLVVDWGLAKPLGRVESLSDSGERTLMPLLGQRQRRDAARQRLGTPSLHEPRAGRGGPRAPRPAIRRLQPRRHPLLSSDRPAVGRPVT